MMNTATTTNSSHWAKTYEYSGVITKMIDICGGLNNEVQMSIKKMVTLLPPEDRSYGMVSNLRKASGMTGALKTRTEGSPKNKHGGRIAYWTWVHDEAWIKQEMMEQYNAPMTCNGIENIMPKVRQHQNGHSTVPVTAPNFVPDAEGVLTPVDQIPPTDMEVKMRAAGLSRKAEGEALIEAARQYEGREAFIKEELKRFAEMGITIDESAIKVEKDPVLEAVSSLVPMFDRMDRLIDRQAESLSSVQQTGAIEDKLKLLDPAGQ